MNIVERLKAKPPKGFVKAPLMIEAADEIERLREALRFMLDNDRNLQKPLEKLFAEFCNEARKALGEKE